MGCHQLPLSVDYLSSNTKESDLSLTADHNVGQIEWLGEEFGRLISRVSDIYSSDHASLLTLHILSVAAFVEFIGTVMFFLFGLGECSIFLQIASIHRVHRRYPGCFGGFTKLNRQHPGHIAITFSDVLYRQLTRFVLDSDRLDIFSVSGSYLQPKRRYSLFICGVLEPLRFLLYIVAEFAGAIVASAILKGLNAR